MGLEYLSALTVVKFIVRRFDPFDCELREKQSQTLLSVWDSKLFTSGAENVPAVHQLSRTPVWQRHLWCQVLTGQAEMAFPAWVGLHSENYSFLTVLWMQSGAEYFLPRILLTKSSFNPVKPRTFICKTLTFFGGKTWGVCVGWSVVDQQWATCKAKKGS